MASPEIIWQLVDLKMRDLPANIFISEELSSVHQFSSGIPPWIDQEITLQEVCQIAIYGCLDSTYHPMKIYKNVRQFMLEYGDEIIDYLVSKTTNGKMSEVWTYQPHDFSGKMSCLFALAIEAWATDWVLLLTDSRCHILH